MTARKQIEKRCKELELTVDSLKYQRQTVDCAGWELWLKDKHGEQFCLTGADAEEILIELEPFEEDLKISV